MPGRVIRMPEITPARSFCWGVLHAIGMFDMADLTNEEKIDCADEKTYFSLGEACMAGMLAACVAVPACAWFAARTDLPLAFIGAAVIFLPLFIFLPGLIRSAMRTDTDAVLYAFGKNEHIRKIFWALFLAVAGLVLARVLDPATVRQILGILTGT